MKERARARDTLLATPLLLIFFVGCVWLLRYQSRNSHQILVREAPTWLVFSPDGKRIGAFKKRAQDDRAIGSIYDTNTRTKICDVKGSPADFGSNDPINYYPPSWSPDGQQIIAGYRDYEVGDYIIKNPHGNIYSEGKDLANEIGKIGVWDARSGQLRRALTYAPHDELSYSGEVKFSSDGKKLIGKGAPPSLFDSATGRRLNRFQGSFKQTCEGKINESLGQVALRSLDRSALQVFDLKSGRVLWQLKPSFYSLFQWQGDMLTVVDIGDATIRATKGHASIVIWDGANRKPIPLPQIRLPHYTSQISFNPDKKTLAYISKMPNVRKSKDFQLTVW
jgi:WD40 repeat protein